MATRATARRHRITAAAKREFVEAIAAGETLSDAAARAGFDRRGFFKLRFNDDGTLTEFGLEVEEALERGTDVVRAEVWRRGVEGVDEPVFQGGKEVGVIRRYSDRMLELLAKGRVPEFRDTANVHVSGRMEVSNPELAAAIDRFTAAVAAATVRAAAGAGEDEAPRAALPAGEG